jgi:Family of unknown function (DUF6370)
MRVALLVAAFAVALGAGPALGADKEPAKAPPAGKKAAAGEVTLDGNMVCAKCALHESKKCQNVLQVTEGGKDTNYYLAPNETAKQNHEHVCSGSSKATVTGTVSEKAGKKTLTASSIKFQ